MSAFNNDYVDTFVNILAILKINTCFFPTTNPINYIEWNNVCTNALKLRNSVRLNVCVEYIITFTLFQAHIWGKMK